MTITPPALRSRPWLLAISIGIFALTFVWSIAGTIALRQALLALLCIAALAYGVDGRSVKHCLRQASVLLLIALSAWIVAHNLTLAWDPARAWSESTQWWRAMLCLVLGLVLGCAAPRQDRRAPWQYWIGALTGAWLLHLLLNVLLKDWLALNLGDALRAATPFGTRDMVSYLGTGALALLLADGVARSAGRSEIFPLAPRSLWAAVFVVTILTAATMTRNAIVVMALEWALAMVALNGLSGDRRQRRRRSGLALAAATLVVAAAAANFMLDSRWQVFTDSARIAWDIEHNDWWIDQVEHQQPVTPQGQPVDHSAYNRIAWIRGASHLIAEYPLGTGYDRNAFRRALMRHYGAAPTASGHAHAGLLDFTLATGIPGGVLFVAALLAAVRYGWKRWRTAADAAGLALTLFAASYLLRAAIDGIVRDHMLEQALFVSALLLAATVQTAREGRPQ